MSDAIRPKLDEATADLLTAQAAAWGIPPSYACRVMLHQWATGVARPPQAPAGDPGPEKAISGPEPETLGSGGVPPGSGNATSGPDPVRTYSTYVRTVPEEVRTYVRSKEVRTYPENGASRAREKAQTGPTLWPPPDEPGARAALGDVLAAAAAGTLELSGWERDNLPAIAATTRAWTPKERRSVDRTLVRHPPGSAPVTPSDAPPTRGWGAPATRAPDPEALRAYRERHRVDWEAEHGHSPLVQRALRELAARKGLPADVAPLGDPA